MKEIKNAVSIQKKIKKVDINQKFIIIIIFIGFIIIIFTAFLLQNYAEKNAFILENKINSKDTIVENSKNQYEIYKLVAEIRQIRSDTSGSLFWLKLVALFVTVGGAVGGYLIGLSRTTQKRLDFEHRKEIDLSFQSIISELSSDEAILRTAAAVKLGSMLQDFPTEWNVSDERREELIQLTKEILAAGLSIEKNEKVLKCMTIALVKKSKINRKTEQEIYPNLRNIDLSGANANDAYWAKVDFSYADFFGANLENTSFRKSLLQNAQFYKANLNEAVLSEADCKGTNFKLADLRYADFRGASFNNLTNFESAKVYGIKLEPISLNSLGNVQVDVSKAGDGTEIITFKDWLQNQL